MFFLSGFHLGLCQNSPPPQRQKANICRTKRMCSLWFPFQTGQTAPKRVPCLKNRHMGLPLKAPEVGCFLLVTLKTIPQSHIHRLVEVPVTSWTNQNPASFVTLCSFPVGFVAEAQNGEDLDLAPWHLFIALDALAKEWKAWGEKKRQDRQTAFYGDSLLGFIHTSKTPRGTQVFRWPISCRRFL